MEMAGFQSSCNRAAHGRDPDGGSDPNKLQCPSEGRPSANPSPHLWSLAPFQPLTLNYWQANRW